ncbi:MAG TPA: FG-GAP repeat protein [Gammaproteobacteria bacterium]|nr:FG-GAP repeat protein [Xanthomonadales bacterium]HOP22778.1 FG-GAP repeat protein [Gammaproteobacteria bacterium]HPI95634.1 FG-GAP repeat protein [Gammaproteobacteria bacterium]HPQ87056.1 FG-GAP repeat protein [Gammaproteobacteria bacterium]
MKYVLVFLALISTQTWSQDWSLVEDMAPVEANESDYGINMVFAEDMLVVSWPRIFTRGNPADNCGEVITYEKVDGMWQELARLTAEDLTGSCVDGDGFGYGLAYDNGRLAIGMPAGARAGIGVSGGMTDSDSRVFLTHFESGNWVLDETLTGSDISQGKGMGGQLVLEGDMLLVHAHEYDSIFGVKFIVSTGVYVFEDNGSGFSETQKLEENFHLFGQDFDYENGQIIVGAWGVQALTQPGRVYVYEKSGSNWSNVQTINDSRNSNLGNQVEIYGDTMVAGNVQAGGIGGVSVYNKANNGQWSEVQFIQANDAAFNDQFGITVRLDDEEIIVGATAGENQTQTLGAVYTFVKDGNGQYQQQQKLIASNPTTLYDRFGGNLIFNDTDLLINSVSGGFANADITTFHHFSREGSSGGNTTYNVDSKVSGTWKSEFSDTQTISLEVLRNGKVLMYAGLNNNEESFWFLGVGEKSDNIIDFPTIYSTSGARFGSAFNSNDVMKKDEGQLQLAFNKCNQAVLSYNFSDLGTSELVLTKDNEIPGNECGTTTKDLPNGVSGSWYDPSTSGQGFTIYLFDENESQKATVTWFTYDENGNQSWISGTGTVTDQTISISNMVKHTGGFLFSGASETTEMGSLTLSWDQCRNAVANYDFATVGLGSGTMNLKQLTTLENTECSIVK